MDTCDRPFAAPFPQSPVERNGAAEVSEPNWLLVTGAPRSGTSFLRALLAEHPQVALLQEYGLTDLVRRIDAIVARAPPAVIDWDSGGNPADVRFNAASRFYRDQAKREGVPRGGGDPTPSHFGSVAMGLFKGMFPDKVPRYVGDKMPITPSWEDLPLLFARLPGFRVIAVIRNPADVVRSSLVRREATVRGRDEWPIRRVRDAVAQWVGGWQTLRALKGRHGPAVAVVKYENLCAQPQAVVDGLHAWLGLPPRPVATPVSALSPDLALHTPEEQAELERLLGPLIEAWPTSDVETLMTGFATFRPPHAPGTPIRLAHDEATPYLEAGFSFQEEWGRWTDGTRAVLAIPHGIERGLLLVDIGVFKAFAAQDGRCDVVVRCGWGEPKLFQLGPEPSRVAFAVQAEETQEPGTLRIELFIARPKRPDEAPSDGRALGILVESVTIRHLQEAGSATPPVRA